MCGLVGVFNKLSNGFTQGQKDVFSTLLMIDTLRGEDSTGAFMVNYHGEVDLIKQATSAPEFIANPAYKKFLDRAYRDGACLIGHNRKATKGDIVDENAHPFVVDDKIVLVHNGTMWGDHKKHADVEVDSHAIAHLLAKHDIEDALGQFFGAYALIWYDVEEEAVHLVRNKERPLWWMETEHSWVWSSEESMLLFVAHRMGIKVLSKPQLIGEDVLNTFTLDNRKWKPSNRTISLRRPPVVFDMKPHFPRNPLACGYSRPDPGTPEWQANLDDEAEEAANAAAERQKYGKPSPLMNRVSTYTVGGSDWMHTSAWEEALCKSCNKTVTSGEFNREILATYNHGLEVKCRAFEFISDENNGYYVYASPVDDPQVVFRHHFKEASNPKEERMLAMTLNEWVLALQVGRKSFTVIGKEREDQPQWSEGYAIIESTACRIVIGGGVVEQEKANAA